MSCIPLPISSSSPTVITYTPPSSTSLSESNTADTNEPNITTAAFEPQQPHTHPIAHFNSKPHPNPTSSLSDVNSSYTLYSVKNGLVRVMERTSKSMLRTLLRGHTKRISDVSFFNNPSNQTDVVGTVSGREIAVVEQELSSSTSSGGDDDDDVNDNQKRIVKEIIQDEKEDDANVLIWRIYKREHELVSEKLLEIRLKDAMRIVWHPFNPNQFVLLHNNRNGQANNGLQQQLGKGKNNHLNRDDDDNDDDQANNEKSEYHIVATLVETTRLMTIKHETENHAVCTCSKRDEIDYNSAPSIKNSTAAGAYGANASVNTPSSSSNNGTLKLICFGPLNQVGIHDLSWSNQDTRHVLTAHNNGCVKLWDLRDIVYLDVRTGEEVHESELQQMQQKQQNNDQHDGSVSSGNSSSLSFLLNNEYIVESARCIMTLNVTNTEQKGLHREVQRCMFLPSFQDASFGLQQGKNQTDGGMNYITSPFLTVTKRGTSASLWSPFTSTGSPPSIVQTFELGGCSPSKEYHVSLCTIPNSMVKNGNDDESSSSLSSTYVLFADKTDGNIFALHLNAMSCPSSSSSTSTENTNIIASNGFDYLVPFRATQPIYSWTAMVSNDDNDQESEEGWKIDLFCVQSKSVQLLTLTSKMLTPKFKAINLEVDALPDGVSVEKLNVDAMNSGNVKDDDDDQGISFDQEEYDVEENDDDIEYDEYDEDEYAEEIEDDGIDDDFKGTDLEATAKTAEEKPIFDNVPPPPMPNFLGGNNDNSNSSSFANWLGNLAGVSTQSGVVKKEEQIQTQAVPPTPQVTPAPPPKMNIDLSNIPLPTGPDVELPKPMKRKLQVDALATESKTILEKPKTTQRYLSPIEMLASSGKEKSESEEIKMVSTKAFDREMDEGKAVAVPKPEKKESKKKSQQKNKTNQQLPFPSKDGKIAILKREDVPTNQQVAPEVATISTGPSATTGPSANFGISKSEVEEIVRKAVSSHFHKQENVITAEIQKAVRYEVQSGLVPTLNKTVSQTLDQTIGKTMKSTVTKTVKESTKINTDVLANEIAQKLHDPLTESFHKSMRDLMIPAFESATRQMFEQISTTVEKGLDLKQNNDSDTTKALEQMSKRMDAMAKTMEVLIQGVAKMTTTSITPTSQKVTSAPSPVDKVESLKTKISELLAAQDYGKAFTTALSASNPDVAVWTCKYSNLSLVLESEIPRLSQPIMLCLMQQLGADFSPQKDEELVVKLAWLQSLALTLDPFDESIKKHLMGVCQQLINNLQTKMMEPNVKLRREMQMLIQVIRGIGRS